MAQATGASVNRSSSAVRVIDRTGLRLGGERPFVRHLKAAATVKSTMNAHTG